MLANLIGFQQHFLPTIPFGLQSVAVLSGFPELLSLSSWDSKDYVPEELLEALFGHHSRSPDFVQFFSLNQQETTRCASEKHFYLHHQGLVSLPLEHQGPLHDGFASCRTQTIHRNPDSRSEILEQPNL